MGLWAFAPLIQSKRRLMKVDIDVARQVPIDHRYTSLGNV